MHLQHLHIRNPIHYIHSLRLQEVLLENHFAHRALLRRDVSVKSNAAAPQPTLITFQTHPTYTVGRRHLNANPLSSTRISFLTGASNSTEAPRHDEPGDATSKTRRDLGNLATFFPSPRGGLLTYHAPGQLTAYLILNLRTHNLTPRCYIRLLENTVIRTCGHHGVPNVMTTEDPGVWVAEKRSDKHTEDHTIQRDVEICVAGSPSLADVNSVSPTDRKICAIGVHVSRGITSHGIGLNVLDSPIDVDSAQKGLYTMPSSNIYTSSYHHESEDKILDEGVIPAPGYLSWGFSRIVACGLEGKSVTWLQREQEINNGSATAPKTPGPIVKLDAVAQSLAVEISRSLKLEDGSVESISEEQVLEPQ